MQGKPGGNSQHLVCYLRSKNLDRAQYALIADQARGFARTTLVVTKTDPELFRFLDQNKVVRMVHARDYIPANFLDHIENCSIGLSKLFEKVDRKYLHFKGVSLSEAIDHDLYARYYNELKDIFMLDQVIAAEKPDVFFLYSGSDIHLDAIKAMIESKHRIEVGIFNPDGNSRKSRFLGILRKLVNIFSILINIFVLRDIIQYLALQFRRKEHRTSTPPVSPEPSAPPKPGKTKPIFAIDNSNASCIDTVLPLFSHFQEKFIITDNLGVIQKMRDLPGSEMLFVSWFKPIFGLSVFSFLFHYFDLKKELGKVQYFVDGYDLSILIRKDLDQIVFRDFPAIINSLIAIEKLIRRKKFDVIVLPTQCTPFDEAIIRLGHQVQIPSLVVQHGICARYYGFAPVITTKMAVWGNRDREFLVRFKANPNQLSLVGCPRFDTLIKASFDRESILKKYDLPRKHIVLLATTQTMTEFYRTTDLLSELLALLSSLEECVFILKPHPSEDLQEYHQLFAELQIKNGIILPGADLNDLIFISYLVITFPSTGPLHSMLLKRQTVLFGPDTIYSGYPALFNISDSGAIQEKLKPMLSPFPPRTIDYRKVLDDFFASLDGESASRVAGLVRELHASSLNQGSFRREENREHH